MAVTRAWQDEVNAEANDRHTLKSRNATTPAGGISSVDNVRTAEYLLDDVEKNLGQMLPDVSRATANVLRVASLYCALSRLPVSIPQTSRTLYSFAFASNVISPRGQLNRVYSYSRDFSYFSKGEKFFVKARFARQFLRKDYRFISS